MACNIIEGFYLDCKNGAAGVKTLYFAQLENVSSVTQSSGTTTAITMVSTKKFYPYQIKPETCEVQIKNTPTNENGTVFTETTITFILYKYNAKNRNIYDLLQQNRLVCVVEAIDQTNTGNILIGESRGGDVTMGEGGLGKAMGDLNGITVTITFKEPSLPTVYTGTLASITA